jgi:histidinol phosphatase-like enzyme
MIIAERNYLSDPFEGELIPGAARSLGKMSEMGFGLVTTTNQSSVRLGFFDLVRRNFIHQRLKDVLAEGWL